MTISKNGLAAIAACLLATTPAISQEEETPNADGSLSGAVISAASGAGIEGALLTFSGGPEPRYASSNEVGGFAAVLPSGSYTLSVSHSSYASPPDREITIQAGIEQNLTIPLSREAAALQQGMEEIVVLGAYRPTALTRSRDSESVVDVLSSEDFAITGDSTAVDALARVPGADRGQQQVRLRARSRRTLLQHRVQRFAPAQPRPHAPRHTHGHVPDRRTGERRHSEILFPEASRRFLRRDGGDGDPRRALRAGAGAERRHRGEFPGHRRPGPALRGR